MFVVELRSPVGYQEIRCVSRVQSVCHEGLLARDALLEELKESCGSSASSSAFDGTASSRLYPTVEDEL